ncbi:MAG TPA: hypothetical protein P5077_08925 [bacterium]|nr:hypothetical protein [bacterium]
MKRMMWILFTVLLLTVTGIAAEADTDATSPVEEAVAEEGATVEEAEPAPAAEPAPVAEPAPAAESAPAVAEGSGGQAPAPVAEEEKKIDTAATEAPAKKEEPAAEGEKEVVRPYFGVAIASGVFGVLAIASGFYFDHLAQKSFNSYNDMTSRSAIEEAAKSADFDRDAYVKKASQKYEEGRQHISSRNYSFIGGAIFLAAGVGLFFWTEEKEPEEGEKKEEPVSDKKVSFVTAPDRFLVNFSASF